MIKALLLSGDREAIHTVTQTLTDFCPNVIFFGFAENIQAGIAMINSKQPDLIFLDTKLTDGNGFELRKHFESCFFKIIFISTHIEYALKAIKFNAVDFLLKPPDPDELIQALNKAYDLISHEEKLQFNTARSIDP